MSEQKKGSLEHIVCVTNRRLAAAAAGIDEPDSAAGRAAFLAQLRCVAEAHPRAVIVREKDLPESSYRSLARDILALCRDASVPCILHTYASAAANLGADGLHLPLSLLARSDVSLHGRFRVLGASCHSAADVREAAARGATYATVGHIFATDCKPGVPPRGLALLREAVQAAPMPVYAIGGITRARLQEVLEAGAAGACVMSGLVRGDPLTW